MISYVQAGALAEKHPIDAFDGSFEYIMTDTDMSEFSFALRIEGDSMEPDFKEGDIIIVDPDLEPVRVNSLLPKMVKMKQHSRSTDQHLPI